MIHETQGSHTSFFAVCFAHGSSVGEGSTQISPNHSFDVQSFPVSVDLVLVWDTALEASVELCEVSDAVPVACDDVVFAGTLPVLRVAGAVARSSQPPNHPGVSQDVVDVVVADVLVGAVVNARVVVVSTVVVIGSSLHPNQPGFVQVVVVYVEVIVVLLVLGGMLVAVPDVMVDSSRQPHQPGVLHVSVLVRVVVFEVDVLVLVGAEEVVVSVPLLSKNFQLKQSEHSSSLVHLGTVSYFCRTSLITLLILCVPIATRQPRSCTVS